MKIDINSDLGEGFGRWTIADDEGMMDIISSANVACGYHAGDAMIMTRMTQLARDRGVALGAHCGLPDRLGFGRVPMDMKTDDLAKCCLYQLGALDAIARTEGYAVTHVSGHGAISEMSRRNPDYSEAMFALYKAYNPDLIIAAGARSSQMDIAKRLGFRTVGKFCGDRAYDDDGVLVNRRLPGAVITNPEAIHKRIIQFLDSGTLNSINGKPLKFDAKSILVHSDTPGAVDIARAIRGAVESGGGDVVPFTELAE